MTQEITNFSDFQFSSALNQALVDMNFTKPSPIQTKTIPMMLEGKDVIALAQTGTGKTAAFALPILQKLNPSITEPQALILAPTRELAIQVAEQFESFSAHQKGISVAILCGGQDYSRQLKQLRQGAQVVVGTPGRILDHIARKTLSLNNLRTFILDEADEMLRMGFIEDVEAILERIPSERQIALFSATMPYRIRQIATTYLNDPVSVEIASETATVKSIEQRFIFAGHHQKTDALVRVLEAEEHQGVIVFVRTKSSTEEVAQNLHEHGLRAMAIHGDLTQSLRERIISQFKQGAIDILVATDVAARGLDVERVTHVINYDIPQDNETYVHRIGRTGRAGRSGVAVLFVTPKESRLISGIERHTRQRIEKVSVPNDHTIQTARQLRLLNSITSRLEHENIDAYRKIIADYVQEHQADAIDVAATLALILNKDLPWKKEFPETAFVKPKERSGRDSDFSRKGSFDKGDFTKKSRNASRNDNFSRNDDNGRAPSDSQELFRIDVGRVHGVKPGNIVGAIANEAGLKSKDITKLKIHDDHSTVCLPRGMSKKIFRDLNNAWVCGRQLNITLVGSAS